MKQRLHALRESLENRYYTLEDWLQPRFERFCALLDQRLEYWQVRFAARRKRV